MGNMSPYCAMKNNPVSHVDPNGDLTFLPILIGAGVGVLINGVSDKLNRQDFFQGWWEGAITGAIGGTLGQFGGGSLLNDVTWGSLEGGITGGIGAELNDRPFMDGFWKGALTGGSVAFISNLEEVMNNFNEGCGFNTDVAIFKNQINDSYFNGTVNWDKANDAFQYFQSRFGGNPIYKGIVPWAMTDPYTGKIYIGRDVIAGGGDMTLNSIIHEKAHYYKSIVWENGVGSRGTGQIIEEGLDIIPNHGTIGYYDAIRTAGKYNTSLATLKGIGKNGIISDLQKMAWDSFGWKKWYYYLPKRF